MTSFREAARIANLGYTDIKGQNMAADVKRELLQAKGIWTCPECGEEWPINDKGFAVTCACVEE